MISTSICSVWEQTQTCVNRQYALCSSGFRAAVDYTLSLYRRVLGGVCTDFCFIESASGCVARLDTLVQPLVTSDDSFSLTFGFCL